VANLFANERINIYMEGFGIVGVVTQDSGIAEISEGELADPTVNIRSDLETVEGIVKGEIKIIDALREGKITYEGVGFFNMLRFAFANFLFNLWLMFSGG
jgi:putative sterol carrier protein